MLKNSNDVWIFQALHLYNLKFKLNCNFILGVIMPIQMLEWQHVVSNQLFEHNSYDLVENDNCFILNTLHNFNFWEYSFFVYPVGLKTYQT